MTVDQEIIQLFSHKEIYIYGAGKVGKYVAGYLCRIGMDVKGILVSDLNENTTFLNLPLYGIDTFVLPDGAYIVLAVGKKFYLEVLNLLVKKGFDNVIQIPDRLKIRMSQSQLECAYADKANGYGISFTEPYTEAGMGIVYDKNNRTPLFRVIEYVSEGQAEQLSRVCTREYIEERYGILDILVHNNEYTEGCNVNAVISEIYVATSHLDNMMGVKKENIFVPLQVGAALTEVRKGCQTDDVGMNISVENANYCECTGLYWIWKNTSGQEYVGLNHYRRRLDVSERDISYLREKNCDMLLALPQYGSMKVKEFFAGRLITELDWDLMMKYVKAYDPSFKSVLHIYGEGDIYISCNLMFAKRKWFDRYCEFAFTVAKQIDSFYKQRGIVRRDRYMGYIFENLLSIFTMRFHDEMHVMYTTVRWIT